MTRRKKNFVYTAARYASKLSGSGVFIPWSTACGSTREPGATLVTSEKEKEKSQIEEKEEEI